MHIFSYILYIFLYSISWHDWSKSKFLVILLFAFRESAHTYTLNPSVWYRTDGRIYIPCLTFLFDMNTATIFVVQRFLKLLGDVTICLGYGWSGGLHLSPIQWGLHVLGSDFVTDTLFFLWMCCLFIELAALPWYSLSWCLGVKHQSPPPHLCLKLQGDIIEIQLLQVLPSHAIWKSRVYKKPTSTSQRCPTNIRSGW